MAYMTFSNVSKFFPGQTILENVSFDVNQGETCALTGDNGTGKSTALSLIAGIEEPDEGTIYRSSPVNFMKQFHEIKENETAVSVLIKGMTLLGKIEQDLKKLENQLDQSDKLEKYYELTETYKENGGFQKKEICVNALKALGLNPEFHQKPLKNLSGGQKQKVFLAQISIASENMILLDEPTNHLDFKGINDLELFVKKTSKTIIFVSHDQRFIEATADKILYLNRKNITRYEGGYLFFVNELNRQKQEKEQALKKQTKLIEKEQEYIDKFKAGTRSRQAKSREKKLSKIDKIETIEFEKTMEYIPIPKKTTTRREISQVKNVSFHYPEALPVFSEITYKHYKTEKTALIGSNGCGKSTFIKLLIGDLKPDEGSVTTAGDIQIGYYDQEFKSLNPDLTPYDFLRNNHKNLSETQLRTYLGTFLFSKDTVFKIIKNLSGGEKGRIALLDIFLKQPDFLILDEPTNNLDIATINVLSQTLKRFPGPILLVTHDRRLIDQVANHILLFDKGKLTKHKGNYSELKEIILKSYESRDEKKTEKKDKTSTSKPKPAKKINLYKVKEAEENIMKIENQIDTLTKSLEDPVVYSDGEKVKTTQAEIMKLNDKLEICYRDWEALTSV